LIDLWWVALRRSDAAQSTSNGPLAFRSMPRRGNTVRSASFATAAGGRPATGGRAGSDGRIGVVAMIDSLERPGGGERMAVEGIRRLDPERFRRSLCITRWSEQMASTEAAQDLLGTLERDGVELIRVERSSRYRVGAWAPLWRELRSGRVDVLHGHLFGSNLWSAVLGTLARVPVVIAHEHMWSYSSGRARPLLDRNVVARFCDAFVAVSAFGLEAMVESEGIPRSKLVLLRNGIDPPSLVERAAARSALGIGDSGFLVGSIGHLRPEKAFEVLIEAVALLRAQGRDVSAAIIGDGEERPKLERLVAELDLGDIVKLRGPREDAAALIGGFDAAVCCSDFEGGPLSVMEYMAGGAPIVATRVGGLPELLEDGACGLLVDPRSPRSLAEGIASAIDDPGAAAARAERARELRAAEYDVNVWVGRLEGLYERLLAQARGVSPVT
jgi:glycosyltransferase involved in cell wall biosynthesis